MSAASFIGTLKDGENATYLHMMKTMHMEWVKFA